MESLSNVLEDLHNSPNDEKVIRKYYETLMVIKSDRENTWSSFIINVKNTFQDNSKSDSEKLNEIEAYIAILNKDNCKHALKYLPF